MWYDPSDCTVARALNSPSQVVHRRLTHLCHCGTDGYPVRKARHILSTICREELHDLSLPEQYTVTTSASYTTESSWREVL